MDNVLAWLTNYAMDHGIGIIFDKNLPPDAPSDSWEFPPMARGVESGESDANLGAIKLLLQCARETDMHFDTYYQFADVFCIPKKHYYLIDTYLATK